MIRITGGELKGRSVRTPPHTRTRPTQARLREALYDAVGPRVQDARVLDLFAGTGVLSFEALSRGAQDVVLVEKDASMTRLIGRNIRDLKLEKVCRLIRGDVWKLGERLESQGPFDLVLCDPPYGQGFEPKLWENFEWTRLLKKGGLLSLEWAKRDQLASPLRPPSFLVKVREKIYGDTCLTMFSGGE